MNRYDLFKIAATKERRRPQHHESELQQQCVQWFALQPKYRKYEGLLFAVPNGGQRSKKTAADLKKEGVVSGVSDLILDVPNKQYHGLRIEMKHGKNKQSESQLLYQQRVTAQGYHYALCYTFEQFQEVINDYLSEK